MFSGSGVLRAGASSQGKSSASDSSGEDYTQMFSSSGLLTRGLTHKEKCVRVITTPVTTFTTMSTTLYAIRCHTGIEVDKIVARVVHCWMRFTS